MIKEIYETQFTLQLLQIYSKVVSRHMGIALESHQNWDDIGDNADKYLKSIFKKYFNLLESFKELYILQEIINQEKFPELESVPEECNYVYYLRFNYQLYKIKIISVIDITARLVLSVYDLNYNFHKINLKNFNKEPLLRNTSTLTAFRSFWNDFLELRSSTRNIIMHEGGYKSALIEKIDEFTIEPNSMISNSEYFSDWFNSQKQEQLGILKAEVSNDTKLVFNHLIKILETLIEPMKNFHNSYKEAN